jgi:hypothetical protein
MPSLGPLFRARALPWWLLYELVTATNAQWRDLGETDRELLKSLVAKSRGWPGNLTPAEREEVRRIVAHIDIKRLALDMVPTLGRRAMRR